MPTGGDEVKEREEPEEKGKGVDKNEPLPKRRFVPLAAFEVVVRDPKKLIVVYDEQIQSIGGIILTTWLTEQDFVPSVKAFERGCQFHAVTSSPSADRAVVAANLRIG